MPRRIPLTKGKFSIIDDDDFSRVSRHRWKFQPNGYATRNAGATKGTVYLHRFIMDAPRGIEIDHINLNKLDNRKANLRFATRSQNAFNYRRLSTNKTGVRGVHFDKSRNKFAAEIIFRGTKIRLGRFESLERAAIVRKKAAIKFHGEFARI